MQVSCIIPCYNVDGCVARAVRSVFSQVYAPIEVIAIDNNSSDQTFRVLKELSLEFPELKIETEKKSGAPAARNLGLKVASGKYLQFLDADDEIAPDKISTQMECAVKNSYPDIIFSDYKRIDDKGVKKEFKVSHQDVWESLFTTKLGVTSSVLFKTETVKIVGGWNEKLKSSQEYDLIFRILKQGGSYSFSDGNFTNVFDRPGQSISSTNQKENWERYATLRMEMLEYIQANKINHKKINKYRQMAFDSLRILYPFNEELAKEYFKKYINGNFKPGLSASTGKAYKAMFSVFGFGATEKFRKILKK